MWFTFRFEWHIMLHVSLSYLQPYLLYLCPVTVAGPPTPLRLVVDLVLESQTINWRPIWGRYTWRLGFPVPTCHRSLKFLRILHGKAHVTCNVIITWSNSQHFITDNFSSLTSKGATLTTSSSRFPIPITFVSVTLFVCLFWHFGPFEPFRAVYSISWTSCLGYFLQPSNEITVFPRKSDLFRTCHIW